MAARERRSWCDHTSPPRTCVSSVPRSSRWGTLRSTDSSSLLTKRGSSWQRTPTLKKSRLSCTAGRSPTSSTLSTSASRTILTASFSRMGKKISPPPRRHRTLPWLGTSPPAFHVLLLEKQAPPWRPLGSVTKPSTGRLDQGHLQPHCPSQVAEVHDTGGFSLRDGELNLMV